MLTRSRRHEWTCQYDISCWQTLIWVVKVELCVSGSPNRSTGKLLRYIRSGVAKTGKEMGRCYCHRGQWQLDSSQAKFSTAASFSASRMRYKRQYKPRTGSAVVSTEHGTRVSRVSVRVWVSVRVIVSITSTDWVSFTLRKLLWELITLTYTGQVSVSLIIHGLWWTFLDRSKHMSCWLAQMGSRPITFLWSWLATDHEPHCRHVPINKIRRWSESTPRSGWWRSHMAGIYSDCSTRKIISSNLLNVCVCIGWHWLSLTVLHSGWLTFVLWQTPSVCVCCKANRWLLIPLKLLSLHQNLSAVSCSLIFNLLNNEWRRHKYVR